MKRLLTLPSLTRLRRTPLPVVLALCALALFAAQFIALWNYRLDYPIDDDWRYYRPGYGLPDVLTLKWLFFPAQDTIHATGKLTDWLFLRWVSHDYRHLAAVSFLVSIGGWLLCTIVFCFRAARNDSALLTASLLTLLLPLAGAPNWTSVSPLQWLEPVVAYHQMLPMLGLMWLLLLCRADGGVRPAALKLILAVAITLFFSLSYASGALSLILFGATLVALTFIARPRSAELSPLRHLGGAILLSATLCLALHLLIPASTHGTNPAFEAREHSLATPLDARFWSFLLGLFDRAVLSTAIGWVPELRGAAIALLFFVLPVGLTVLLARGKLAPETRVNAVGLVALFVAVSGYCGLVSYGRANFGAYYFLALHPDLTQATLYAKTRFFFWWITATLPLIVVAWGIMAGELWSRRTANLLVFAMAFLLLCPKAQWDDASYFHHWNYPALYHRDSVELRDLIERDVVRSRGAPMHSWRRREWRELPPGVRNPRYRFYEKLETYRLRKPAYARAGKLEAKFVGRWGLD